jgi:hypothetical protein
MEERLGLVREQSPRIVRRAILAVLLTWVPLLILSVIQGHAVGHLVEVPFLRDFAVHARFLLALPILIAAEVILGPQMAEASIHFVESGVVQKEDYERFDSAVEKGLGLRNSTSAEFGLILLAYIFTYIAFSSTAIHVSSWHGGLRASTNPLTWAGFWYGLFCVPLFQFLTLRWLWRLFLWSQFLWRMSRLDLQLIATHPDEAGGIAFIGRSHRFFAVILFAASCALSGVLANNIIYNHLPLIHFWPAIAIYAVLAVAFVLAPLFVFTPSLLRTKIEGHYKYGTLATEYTSAFQKKWIDSPHPRGEEVLGTGDIQSLADLGNSFAYIEKMGPLPMGPRTPIVLIVACLLPMVPLALTMMPLVDILKMLLKFII